MEKTAVSEIDATVAAEPAASPLLWTVLAAPFIYLHAPARAAEKITGASRSRFLLCAIFSAALYAAAIVFLVLWKDTVRIKWVPLCDQPAFVRQGGHTQLSFAEVWDEWHLSAGFGLAEALFFFVALGLLLGEVIVAWCFLSSVYDGVSARASYGRAFRVAAASTGFVTIATLGIGSTIVRINHQLTMGHYEADDSAPYLFIIGLVVIAGWIGWLTRAAQAVRRPVSPPELPPLCEDCGYNLTHVPADGRCPECASDVARSLSLATRRVGTAWQRSQDAGGWLSTTAAVVSQPWAFYSSIKMRVPENMGRRFARLHYPLIGLAAAVWTFLMWACFDPSPGDELLFMPPIVGLLAPLTGWALHRFIGSCVVSWWIVCDTLPDARWTRAILAYETAYLWAFCLFNGTLITSFFCFEMWMTDVVRGLGLPWFMGLPWEPLAVLLGNAALILLWFWRFATAARRVRWSNF